MVATTISGIGESPPSRRSGTTGQRLALSAICKSLTDAGLAASDIDAVVTESQICPHIAPLDRIMRDVGLVNVQIAMQSSPVGAGILSALAFTTELVASGRAKHALTYFAIDWGTHPEGPSAFHSEMVEKDILERPTGFLAPALYFATMAKRYQHVYGLTDERMEELLSSVVLAARANAAEHPEAQQRKAMDLEGYRANSMIAEPLHAADCALLSDGAGAIVVSRRDTCRNDMPSVEIAGWSYDSDPITFAEFYTQSPWLPALPAASRASARAFAAARMMPKDIDLYQIYDCFSISPVLQLEAIGRCKPGKTLDAIADGAMRFDGAMPLNTHGGLLCHGHIFSMNHAIEAVRQLRGDAGNRQVKNARRAFVGAGPGRQYTSLILQRGEN